MAVGGGSIVVDRFSWSGSREVLACLVFYIGISRFPTSCRPTLMYMLRTHIFTPFYYRHYRRWTGEKKNGFWLNAYKSRNGLLNLCARSKSKTCVNTNASKKIVCTFLWSEYLQQMEKAIPQWKSHWKKWSLQENAEGDIIRLWIVGYSSLSQICSRGYSLVSHQ